MRALRIEEMRLMDAIDRDEPAGNEGDELVESPLPRGVPGRSRVLKRVENAPRRVESREGPGLRLLELPAVTGELRPLHDPIAGEPRQLRLNERTATAAVSYGVGELVRNGMH